MQFTISGDNFFSGLVIQLQPQNGPVLQANNISVVDPHTASGTFELSGITAGVYNVIVNNTDTLSSILSDAFTVVDVPSPTPTPTPTPSPTPTEEPTPTPSESPTPSPTPTEEPSPTPTEEPTPTPTPSEEPTPTPTPSATPTPEPAPIVSSITPNAETTGRVVPFVITGAYFSETAVIELQPISGTVIEAINITVESPTRVVGNFDLTTAALGVYDVVVTNDDLQVGSLAGGFTITEETEPTPTPSPTPTEEPSPTPTEEPIPTPTPTPTATPTPSPTPTPSATPTPEPVVTISSINTTTTPTEANITWQTDLSTTSQVRYGLLNSNEHSTEETSLEERTTNHQVSISNLSSCSKYAYSVRSVSGFGNAASSATLTFYTKGCPGNATVLDSKASLASAGQPQLISMALPNQRNLAVSIPAQTLAVDTVFQVLRLRKSEVLSETELPAGFNTVVGDTTVELKALTDISTPTTTFDRPLIISIPYTRNEITQLREDSLRIARWDGSTWHVLNNCVTNTTEKNVTCSTRSFSLFALVAKNKSKTSSATPTPTPIPLPSPEVEPNSCSTPAITLPPVIKSITMSRTSAKLEVIPAYGTISKYTVAYKNKEKGPVVISEFTKGLTESPLTFDIKELSPDSEYVFSISAVSHCAATTISPTFTARTQKYFWQNDEQSEEVDEITASTTTQHTLTKQDTLTPTPTSTPATVTLVKQQNLWIDITNTVKSIAESLKKIVLLFTWGS